MEKTERETGRAKDHLFGSRVREHFNRGGGAWEAVGSSVSDGVVVANSAGDRAVEESWWRGDGVRGEVAAV